MATQFVRNIGGNLDSLIGRAEIEIRNELKKKKCQVNLGELHSSVQQRYDYSRDAHDIVNGLPNHISRILEQRFLHNMTMVEIGKANGYSRETARRRLKNAIKICKKKHRELI